MNAQTLGNEWDSGDICDPSSPAYNLDECVANDPDDSGNVCDTSSKLYNQDECDAEVANDPSDSGNVCDTSSRLYNQDECDAEVVANPDDSGNVCDTSSRLYNQDECDAEVAADPEDSGDVCDTSSRLYNQNECNQQEEDLKYDQDACTQGSVDYNPSYCESLCDESSNNYNEYGCEQSNCIDVSPNYSDVECNKSSCSLWSPNYEPDYCASLCEDSSDNYDILGCFISETILNVNSLSEEELNKLKSILEQMKSDCFYSSLLNNLDVNLTIKIDPTISTPGNYNPSTNTITMRNDNDINEYCFVAELFHAFQQQLDGRLLTIKNSSDCTGRSNIEFEEKFQYFVDAVINNKPYVTFSDMYGVDIWINNLTTNNGGKFPTDFTLTQRNEYLNYVNQFQQAHLGSGYGCPVDTSMSIPNTVIAIIVNSACQ